jgi:hypothetical protein
LSLFLQLSLESRFDLAGTPFVLLLDGDERQA